MPPFRTAPKCTTPTGRNIRGDKPSLSKTWEALAGRIETTGRPFGDRSAGQILKPKKRWRRFSYRWSLNHRSFLISHPFIQKKKHCEQKCFGRGLLVYFIARFTASKLVFLRVAETVFMLQFDNWFGKKVNTIPDAKIYKNWGQKGWAGKFRTGLTGTHRMFYVVIILSNLQNYPWCFGRSGGCRWTMRGIFLCTYEI